MPLEIEPDDLDPHQRDALLVILQKRSDFLIGQIKVMPLNDEELIKALRSHTNVLKSMYQLERSLN